MSTDYNATQIGAQALNIVPELRGTIARVWVRNTGPVTVWIGFDESVDGSSGIPLAPGDERTVDTDGGVWAVVTVTGSPRVAGRVAYVAIRP